MAPGRGGNRRVEAEGPVPPPRHRVRARHAAANSRAPGGRSQGFHLRDAIDLVAKRDPALISRFGGHAFAAGLTIAEAGLPAFTAAFEQVARERLTPAQLQRTHESDGALGRGELTLELAVELRERVWGQGMPAPAFDDTFDVTDARVVGGKHSRVGLSPRRRAIRRHRVQPRRTPAGANPGGLPAGSQRMAGQALVAAHRSSTGCPPEPFSEAVRAAAKDGALTDRSFCSTSVDGMRGRGSMSLFIRIFIMVSEH